MYGGGPAPPTFRASCPAACRPVPGTVLPPADTMKYCTPRRASCPAACRPVPRARRYSTNSRWYCEVLRPAPPAPSRAADSPQKFRKTNSERRRAPPPPPTHAPPPPPRRQPLPLLGSRQPRGGARLSGRAPAPTAGRSTATRRAARGVGAWAAAPAVPGRMRAAVVCGVAVALLATGAAGQWGEAASRAHLPELG